MKASFVSQLVSRICFCVALTTLSLTAVAEAAQVDVHKQYTFNLPRQTVADSLNDIAKHTGAQFLFPYELAKSVTAKPVSGYFTLLEATSQLLQNTGLKSDLVDGVLTISSQDDASTAFNQSKGKSMNIKHRKSLLATLVGLFAAGGAATATAQDEMQESSRVQRALEEIVVTAQKREQNLQETALAISAIGADALAARGISSGYDLQFSVPGLTIGESNVGPAQITLRGVGMENIFLGGDPGVPVHIDGHYIQDTSYILQDFMDIERVEVLRGPQGTLYGRNAIGGSINVITKRPGDEFEGSIAGQLGNYDKQLLQLLVSGALTDRIRGRLVVSNDTRDGYVDNVSPVGGQDLKNSDYTSVRGTLVFDVADNVEAVLGSYYYEDHSNAIIAQHVTPIPDGVLPGFADYWALNDPEPNPTVSDPRKVRFNSHKDDALNRAKGISLDVDWELDAFNLRSLSSFNESRSFALTDVDGTDVITMEDEVRREHETFTQEFQLLSSESSVSQWILGLYYFNEESSASEIFDWDNFFVADGSASILDAIFGLEAESIGVFGQIEYPLSNQLSVVGGLRYNKDEKDNDSSLFSPDLGITDGAGNPFRVVDSESWEEITGKLGINYQVSDDMLIYASYSSGYKAGGYNGTQASYDPETVEAYEGGVKSEWLDNRVQSSLSAFFYDYKDKQEFKRDELGIAAITNAGSASLWGIEFEGVVRPIESVTVDTSIAYLNSEYDEFDTADNINPGAGVLDLSGNALPRSPEWKVHLGIQYDWQIQSGHMHARVDAVWVDEQYSAAFNRDDRDLIDSYHRTNAQIGWESNDESWKTSVYVNNIEDDDVVANLFDNSALVGLPVPIYAHYFSPRTYGVKVTYQF